MKSILILAILFISQCVLNETFAQQEESTDTIYHVQNPVLIPTESGVDISAIIVRKKSIEEPIPVVLFYTTYH